MWVCIHTHICLKCALEEAVRDSSDGRCGVFQRHINGVGIYFKKYINILHGSEAYKRGRIKKQQI